MMRGERCEPVNGKIMYPNHEDWYIDREDPQHEYKN